MSTRQSRSRRKNGAPPRCVLPEHLTSDVRFNGTYGPPGHKRQRYLCRPKNGDPEHTFTELLPRQMTHSGDCDQCERPFSSHEGPPTPREYWFSAHDISRTLMALGSGKSYRDSAKEIRELTGRAQGSRGKDRIRHGQLAGDWTEVFAPVIFEHFRQELADEYEKVIAGEGTLLLDHVPFFFKREDDDRSHPHFMILVAMSATAEGGNQLQSVKAYFQRGLHPRCSLARLPPDASWRACPCRLRPGQANEPGDRLGVAGRRDLQL